MSRRALLAAPPDVLRWSPRSSGHGDCAVAAIELACGVTYEVALAGALEQDPHVLTQGLTLSEIRHIIRTFGYAGKVLKKGTYELDDDTTGILAVKQPHVPDSEHVVYVWEGRIIEPKADRRQLWLDAEQFLHHYKYRAGSLLTIVRAATS